MPLACFCFGRPASPGAAELVAKNGTALGEGVKGAANAEDAASREQLIGTTILPVNEPPAEPLGALEGGGRVTGGEMAAEGSEAPLLGAAGAADPAAYGGSGGTAVHTAAGANAANELDAAGSLESSGGGSVDAAPEARIHSSSSQGEGRSPDAEDSTRALLQLIDEVSLKAPRLSRLSALFCTSSSGTGADGGEQHSKQGLQEGGSHVELQFDMAAAELALLPRAKLLPLAQPEAALADAADVLGAAAMPQMLAALLTLRRVAIHHKHLLVGSLGDTAALLLECMHSGDAAVAQAAVMALLDLLATFGNAMLRHLEPPPPADQRSLPQQHSCLLALLMAAALGSTPSIRHWADEALSFLASRLHQARVVAALEPYIEHALAAVRQVASHHLMCATYRPPDRPSPPVSPMRRQQR